MPVEGGQALVREPIAYRDGAGPKDPTVTLVPARPDGLSRYAVSIADATVIAGVGRTTIREAIAAGELAAFHVGRRTLLRVTDVTAWLDRRATNSPITAA